MTDKSDDRVGHLNNILGRGGGNSNNSIFKSSNASVFPGKGGAMLKFRVDRRITVTSATLFKTRLTTTLQVKITFRSKLFCPS